MTCAAGRFSATDARRRPSSIGDLGGISAASSSKADRRIRKDTCSKFYPIIGNCKLLIHVQRWFNNINRDLRRKFRLRLRLLFRLIRQSRDKTGCFFKGWLRVRNAKQVEYDTSMMHSFSSNFQSAPLTAVLGKAASLYHSSTCSIYPSRLCEIFISPKDLIASPLLL